MPTMVKTNTFFCLINQVYPSGKFDLNIVRHGRRWAKDLSPSCSNLDLAPDLDHVIAGELEIVAHARRVAAHRGEQGLLPARDARSVPGRNDGLGADIEGQVAEIDLHPLGLALGQNLGNVRMLH